MIWNCILVLSLLFVTFFKTKRSLHMLQQNLYNENNRYVKWIFKNIKQFLDWDIIILIISLVVMVGFYDFKTLSLIAIILIIIIHITITSYY